MPTRKIRPTHKQDAFVEREMKLGLLRAHIGAGLDALERGDFTKVAGADLDRLLQRLAAKPAECAR